MTLQYIRIRKHRIVTSPQFYILLTRAVTIQQNPSWITNALIRSHYVVTESVWTANITKRLAFVDI